MGSRIHFTSGLIFFLLSSISIALTSPTEWIRKEVSDYFQRNFKVSSADLQLRLIHIPESKISNINHYRVVIESNQSTPRLGFQTLWVKVFEEEFLEEKFPIVVDATVYIDVVVAATKIKRGEMITPGKIAVMRKRVSQSYINVLRDPKKIEGLMAKHLIRPQTILRMSMVATKPDIRRGDKVTVKFISGDLVVTTSGKAKQDGIIGDKVKVVCEPTGKQVQGAIQSQDLVIVHLQ